MRSQRNLFLSRWLTRLVVGTVFAWNVVCALAFILQPDSFTSGFEISGVPGIIIVQGFGILFLMWNATYPLVLLQPSAQNTLFTIILIQQAIGVAGEVWLWLALPAGHAALSSTGFRFILFDGTGLALMALAYGYMLYSRKVAGNSEVNFSQGGRF